MPNWWRRNATIRLQTTLVAVLVTGAALVGASFAVLRAVGSDITARVQGQVSSAAQQVAKQLAAGVPPKGFVFHQAVESGFVPPSVTVTDLDTGEIVAALQPAVALEAGGPPGISLPEAPIPLTPANLDLSDAITETIYLTSGGTRLRVVAFSPSSVVSRNTSALRGALAAGFPALAILVGLVTWILTGRSLRPVEQMRAEVEEISAHTLDRRVPAPETGDEIARLAHTMNRMLDRLESSALRQREFVSDASHELRSPIAAIRSQLEVAIHDPAHAEWMNVAAGALAENERLERLVEDLLTLARLDEGRIPAVEDVDLEDVVRDEAARLHDPRVQQSTSPIRVRANREQIARVVRNLLENADRFARDRIDLGLSKEGGAAVIAVSDDGPGIPEADRERVFARFTRLDESRARSHGGVGLGLALVRAIAVAHGGTVEAEAAGNGGARLVVRLPHAPE